MTNFPPLYKKGKNQTLFWEVWADKSRVFTRYGVLNGKYQESSYEVEETNIGKKNYRNKEEQAKFEANSLWLQKQDKGYKQDQSNIHAFEVRPMTAGNYAPKRLINHNQFFIQPKLDGFRCMAYWEGGEVKLISRGFKLFTIPHIQEELKKILPQNLIYDGELYHHGLLFETISSMIKVGGPPGDTTLKFNVYDLIDLNNLNLGFYDRFMNHNINSPHVTIVPTKHIIKTQDDLYKEINSSIIPQDLDTFIQSNHDTYCLAGYEGMMVRLDNLPYEIGNRSKSLLKVKAFQDAEFEIINIEPGQGKFEDAAVFTCMNDLTYNTFECSMATSMEERKKILAEKDSYIGKKLTVKFSGRYWSKLPRNPVGLRIRPEEDLDN